MSDPLAAVERAKYEAVWALPDYRAHSPAVRIAGAIASALERRPSETLNDYGCGTGRGWQAVAGDWCDPGFDRPGFCVDHVFALEVSVPFIQAGLWAMGTLVPASDLAMCIDVLEHLPTKKVGEVLVSIRERTRRRAVFQVAMFPDSWAGLELHLTVRPAPWWLEQLNDAGWAVLSTGEEEERRLFVVAEPRHG